MNKVKLKRIKEQKGITLVALIITIIVLLILAVVTISAVQDGGIIQYAKNAKEEYGVAKGEEQVVLNEYLVKIEEEIPNPVFGAINANNYGDSIEYSAGTVDDWKIFYKDNTNLYIIASDYLENSKLPTGLKMSPGFDKYSVYWASSDDFVSTGASTITSEIAGKWKLDWLSQNSSSTSENAKAVGDLLNVDIWTAKFGDASKKIEAIGAPTLKMWVDSWNAKGAVLGTNKYVSLKTESNATGYFIGPTSTESLSEIANNYSSTLGGYFYSIGTDTKGYEDELYFPYTDSVEGYCSGYWLASPSAAYNGDIMLIKYHGEISKFDRIGDISFAVRPLVSIPANLITMDEEGNFVVKQ